MSRYRRGTQQAAAPYGPANEMISLSYYGYNETRTYNNLLQLTRQTVPGVFDTEYVFPGGANNGQISAAVDHISGQQVNYTYDSLKRLSTAGTSGTGWGQACAYDRFGNLTAATVTKGSGVNFAQAYDASTNHAAGNVQFAYDANGNETWPSASYDGENRMITPDGYKTYTVGDEHLSGADDETVANRSRSGNRVLVTLDRTLQTFGRTRPASTVGSLCCE